MKYNLNAKIALLAIGSVIHLTSCASDGFETWKTEITCDQQHFTITSFCKPSNDPYTMNTCKGEQLLVKEGQAPRGLPLTETKAINKRLRATYWECQKVGDISYLKVNYAAGLGNHEEDEAIEFYDLQMNPINDKSRRKQIIQNGQSIKEGRVKSLMPD